MLATTVVAVLGVLALAGGHRFHQRRELEREFALVRDRDRLRSALDDGGR